MIALPPYFAEYQALVARPDGKHKREWQNCKVLGVTANAGDEPVYLIEIYHGGTSSLTTTEEVKRLERSNPL